MLSIEEVDEIARRENSLPVSCQLSLNMDSVLVNIWGMMGLLRIYTKKVRFGSVVSRADVPHCVNCCRQAH
jgi:ribosome-interacting GTPase 1